MPEAGRAARAQNLVNALAALGALALATATLVSGERRPAPPQQRELDLALPLEPEETADGRRALRDRSGHLTPLVEYRRIASASATADPLLDALCEDERVVAFSRHSLTSGPDPHRYTHKPSVDWEDTEALLSLAPDLVLINSFHDRARVERLRALGLEVFDLGRLEGLSSLLAHVGALGWLLGAPERARRFGEHFVERLHAVAADIPAHQRERGLYVSLYGTQLFGGTRGSSYHEVLTYAGLVDVAAERYSGWPSYTPEQLLTLQPHVLVTRIGMREALCRHSELSALQVCATGRFVEVDPALLDDAGVYMLDAAEVVRRAVYGERRAGTRRAEAKP